MNTEGPCLMRILGLGKSCISEIAESSHHRLWLHAPSRNISNSIKFRPKIIINVMKKINSYLLKYSFLAIAGNYSASDFISDSWSVFLIMWNCLLCIYKHIHIVFIQQILSSAYTSTVFVLGFAKVVCMAWLFENFHAWSE